MDCRHVRGERGESAWPTWNHAHESGSFGKFWRTRLRDANQVCGHWGTGSTLALIKLGQVVLAKLPIPLWSERARVVPGKACWNVTMNPPSGARGKLTPLRHKVHESAAKTVNRRHRHPFEASVQRQEVTCALYSRRSGPEPIDVPISSGPMLPGCLAASSASMKNQAFISLAADRVMGGSSARPRSVPSQGTDPGPGLIYAKGPGENNRQGRMVKVCASRASCARPFARSSIASERQSSAVS